MARYVRLYDSPTPERPGSILGFSKSITDGAYDDFLCKWLSDRGYTPTKESKAQQRSHVVLPRMPLEAAAAILKNMGILDVKPEYYAAKNTIPSSGYYEAPGIPLPEGTVSAAHLFVEPPLHDEDLEPLGVCLSSLEALYDGGLRRHHFVDSRATPAAAEDVSNVIYSWG